MDDIQEIMSELIGEQPRVILAQILDEKLRAQGIRMAARKREELAARILKESTDTVNFDYGSRSGTKNIAIGLTDEDIRRAEEALTQFADRLPEMMEEIIEQTMHDLFADYKRRWARESQRQRGEMNRFRKNLQTRWGAGLEAGKMLVTLAREYGMEINHELRAGDGVAVSSAFDILVRLHARACQVSSEIVCLLDNGFADGAMARWRTLHEIASVAFLVSQHGDSLAERYVAHGVVEARKAARQYQRHQERLGQEPITDDEMRRIEEQYAAAIEKYGKAFGAAHGWAAECLGKDSPTIADIQEAAAIDHLSPYYRMASHNVHANPKGVFFKLGLIGESEILLAGPSNAGLADPGHAAALSLVQVTSALLQTKLTTERMVGLKIMLKLADEIGEALLSAHRKMVEEEASRAQ